MSDVEPSDRNLSILIRNGLEASLEEARWLMEELYETGAIYDLMGLESWRDDILYWCKWERSRVRENALEAGVSPETYDNPGQLPELPGRRPGRQKEGERSREVEEGRHVSQRTKDHADVTAKLVARHASERKDVIEFWSHFLNGGLASDKEARTMRASTDFLPQRDQWGRVVEGVAKSYGWDHEKALWFLLTGEPPEIEPIQVQHVSLGDDPNAPVAIQLTVFPGTLAKEVDTAYRAAQYELLQGDNRQLSNKVLQMFRFVLEQESDPKRTLSPREQMERWDEEHTESRAKYRSLQKFNRDRKRAERIIRKFLSGNANRGGSM